ncbi:MAG: sulfite exporter TauE/SafE family protein [Burkholderiales bacterium]
MSDVGDLGATAVLACAVAMIAGGTVKGVVGIGLPLVSLPVMATFIPVPKAMALLLLSSFATSVWQTFQGGLFTQSLKRFWPLFAGMAIGTPISVRMLATFDVTVLYLILGTIVSIFAALLHRSLVLPVPARAERWAAPVVGAASGFVGGLSMLFGPIYAMYLAGLKLDKERFVAVIALSNVWATLVLGASMARFDLFGGTDFVASLFALIPSFAGLAIGVSLRGYINEDLFRRTLAAVLFLIGLNLIRKALT